MCDVLVENELLSFVSLFSFTGMMSVRWRVALSKFKGASPAQCPPPSSSAPASTSGSLAIGSSSPRAPPSIACTSPSPGGLLKF